MVIVRAQRTQQFVDGGPFQRMKLGRDAQPYGNLADLAMLGPQPLDLESKKPITPPSLLRKVREVLDNTRTTPPPAA